MAHIKQLIQNSNKANYSFAIGNSNRGIIIANNTMYINYNIVNKFNAVLTANRHGIALNSKKHMAVLTITPANINRVCNMVKIFNKAV